MKNREKYNDFLTDCLVNHKRFGVDKATNEPFYCENTGCSDCKFFKFNTQSCPDFRKEWLEEEVDKWKAYRDLNRGDVAFVKMGTVWLPVIFVGIECDKFYYTSCLDDDGEFVFQSNSENDPQKVRKDIRRD